MAIDRRQHVLDLKQYPLDADCQSHAAPGAFLDEAIRPAIIRVALQSIPPT
jgi:hypothetical protein